MSYDPVRIGRLKFFRIGKNASLFIGNIPNGWQRKAVALIPPDLIEKITQANDIVDVIGSYFPLKRSGPVFKALCPFHKEKTPSFTVNPQRQIFKCFGCNAGGSVIRFVMNYENLDFPSAARRLAERAGIVIPEEDFTGPDKGEAGLKKRLLRLHQEATEWFERCLRKSPGAQGARDYLRSRGINHEVAGRWKIGYAPNSWDAFSNWATGHGYIEEELLASGLVSARQEGGFYDRFRNRVMFPICNEGNGEVIAFSGRILEADPKAAKYVNSPETLLFKKGSVLFGLHKSKRALIEKGTAVVLEGQIDVISAFEAGVQNVIAPQGTAFTDRQAQILKRYVQEVILCFDSDAAGQKATERSLGALLDANLIVSVAVMPPGHDPDSLIREHGAAAFAEQIASAHDFFDYQIERQARTPEFATPRGRMQFARNLAESVRLLTDPVLRDTVMNKVAARLEIPTADFRTMLAKAPAPPRTESSEKLAGPAVPSMSNTLRLLCQLALTEPEARTWLFEQPWREILESHPEADLLLKILSAEIRPGEANSITAFSSTLAQGEDAIISSLLLEKRAGDVETLVRDCWRDLRVREIKRRQESLASRLRTPNLPMEEVGRLQKEILDLQKRFTDIARPLSPGSRVQ